MGRGFIGRHRELRVVRSFIGQARAGPAVLVIDGEAGIGKTTLCRSAIEAATECGFATLTTSGAAAEVSMAWAALSDLAVGIDNATLPQMSGLHQRTLQAITGGGDETGGDERLVASAFRAAVEQSSRCRPTLIVIDDAQWLDQASRRVIGFAMRRLTGPVAVLVAYRSNEPGGEDRSWVQPADPRALNRLTLGPMSPVELTSLLASRARDTPSRADLARILSIADGNPLYALEFTRYLAEGGVGALEGLPPTLAALVRNRVGVMDDTATEILVTAAAAFDPDAESIASATGRTTSEVVDILAPMEGRGVLRFDGPRIRFTHPLIATGVISDAEPHAVRRAHRRLADTSADLEQRARHLALSSPCADADTLAALDAAAERAAAKGAFSTAAELVGLAIGLGGDDHIRRLRGAEYHFRSGALGEAEALVAPIIDDLPPGLLRAVGLLLLAAVRGYEQGIAGTIGLFRRAMQEAEGILPLRTQALVVLSLATGIGGDMATCVADARRARADAELTGLPDLRSQALSLWSHVSFMYGLGTDSEALAAALEIEDPDTDAPIMLRPTPVQALNHAWTGRLDEARVTLTEVRRRCEERGADLDVLWATEQLTWIDVAAGRYDDAERWAAEAMSLAQRIGGQLPLITAHTALAHAAAYRGRLEDARAAAEFATGHATKAGLGYLVGPPLMSLAFAQVSHGRHEEALKILEPLLATFDPEHDTEIMAGAWIPDAVTALTATGRTEEAEPLVGALETNGLRRDRPWMLAIGARCRALVLAAQGDLEAAVRSAEQAMVHHDRLPMPFERARTQLLLGQLLRSRRNTTAARTHLESAATVFEAIGSPLWTAQVHDELARLTGRSAGPVLTPAEGQVAGRAAAGQTNKEIAAALFLSTKTVEMHLSNVYRKLGIRSRVQLVDGLRNAHEVGGETPQQH